MLIIGVTGGTGCGKTTLLRQIETRGGACLDCDSLYYELLSSDQALRRDLQDAFGNVFLPSGSLDRQRLGRLVFGEQAQLDRLNKIIFFHIGRAVRLRIDAEAAKGRTLFGVDAINLVESGLAALCNVTVGVLASTAERIARIMTRDSISEEYAKLRIAAQKPDSFYRANCSVVIENCDQSPQAFERHAGALVDQLIKEYES